MPEPVRDTSAPSHHPDLVTTALLLTGPFFLIVGLVLLGWNVIFLSDARSTEGEVVRLVESASSNTDGVSYKPEIRYAVPGGETFTRTTTWSTNPPVYRVGDRIKVLYDPDDPGTMVPDDFMGKWLMTLIFLGVGNILTIIGLFRTRAEGRAATAMDGTD